MLHRLCTAVLAAACAAGALASGASDPEDTFVMRRFTDVPLEAYDKGELGVLLPSYPRVYLYPAWRAIVLGRDGLRANPTPPGALRQAAGSFVEGWVGPKHPWNRWLEASERFAARPKPQGTVHRNVMRGTIEQYVNCPDGAFTFAVDTLRSLQQRADADPRRLAAWVQAQDAVFAFCDWDGSDRKPPPPVPEPLAAVEPAAWRQLRDYQIASAHFYNESWAESTRRFEQIAATRGHPMRGWGAYLALRSQLRAAGPAGKGDTDASRAAYARLRDRADRILADPSLQAVHEATRATLRAAQFRFLPRQRLDETSALLAQAAADPYRASTLGDWRRLMNQVLDDGPPKEVEAMDAALRGRHAYIDWMRTLQRCGFAHASVDPPQAVCKAERAHALERWTRTGGPEKRAWLLAALTLAEALTPALEKAAAEVAPEAPEYLSVQYQLARLYRLGGQPQRTRDIAQAALGSQRLAAARSNSAFVLFAQERFATATSRDDAVPWLQRELRWAIDEDTGEAVPYPDRRHAIRLAADGLAWVNQKLAVSELLALARDPRLQPDIRAGIAIAAWMRADLLGQQAAAADAARIVAADARLAHTAAAYLQAGNAAARRHVLLLASLRKGLTPDVESHGLRDAQANRSWATDSDQPVAGMWCAIGGTPDTRPAPDPWSPRAVEQVPPTPDLSADKSARDRELAALGRLKTATGVVGDHVLARARTHPDDPELPWLLHVVVQSTRGGCLDKDSRTLSRTAWQLLHRRFPGSEWARKTPYYF
jgi:hypothetical protein